MNKRTILPPDIVRPDEASPLPAADSIAIHELLNRIFLAEDSRDLEALRQLVTDDFTQVHSLFGTLTGREAFAEWVHNNPAFFDGFRHQAINSATSSTGEGTARAVSYILVFQLFSEGSDSNALPRLIGHGVVRDSLTKHGDIWRLSKRVYDQFSILPAFAPDAEARRAALQSVDD